ncbi:14740_t:CDS:2, partial [Dentiscutata erythropus]
MKKAEYAFVVALLQDYFKVPNRSSIINPPITVLGASAHYQPCGGGRPSAPDIAIYPSLKIILKPPIPTPPPQYILRFVCRTSPRTSRYCEISPVDQSARLWTRQATPTPGRHITVTGQPGVYYEE